MRVSIFPLICNLIFSQIKFTQASQWGLAIDIIESRNRDDYTMPRIHAIGHQTPTRQIPTFSTVTLSLTCTQ